MDGIEEKQKPPHAGDQGGHSGPSVLPELLVVVADKSIVSCGDERSHIEAASRRGHRRSSAFRVHAMRFSVSVRLSLVLAACIVRHSLTYGA